MTVTAPPRPPAPAAPARPSPGRRAWGFWLRWWRRLTAMRTAIVLLFLLALAAVPGSLLPQRSLSQNNVTRYFADHPTLAPLLDRLYLFGVFSSPWFAAIYLLLFISLIGCVLPRAAEHFRALRSPPPPAPKNLLRLPDSGRLETELAPAEALDVVEVQLRGQRFRVVRRGAGELSAEKGYLKETGNLVFHLALLALLVSLAFGKLWGYEGSILVTEGEGFCNTFQLYDTYSAGPLVEGSDLNPLCIDLDDFKASYEDNLTASSFTADISYGPPGQAGQPATIGVNDPLRTDGDRVYVTGHGYSLTFTVTAPGQDPQDVTSPFLPSDQRTLGSQGVVKVPDLGTGSDKQLALAGFFAPTGVIQNGVLASLDPRLRNPEVAVQAYQGYLGLDSGQPQSVYSLDQEQIDRGALVQAGTANLSVGETLTLDDGTTITFTGVKEFAAIQLSHDPGQVWVLGSAIAVLIGLLGMLLLRRERVFARSAPAAEGGGTVLTIGSLTRGGGEGGERFAVLSDTLSTALRARADTAPPQTPRPEAPPS